MAKYLTREQVVADFNANFSDLFEGMTDENLEKYWNMNLDMLLETRKISPNQRKTWVFNKKDLEL
jgi:hypothetical protein